MAFDHSPIKNTTEMQQSESFNHREQPHGSNEPKIVGRFDVKGLYMMFTCPQQCNINNFAQQTGQKLKNFCIHEKFPSLYLTMLHMNRMDGIVNKINDNSNDFWNLLHESRIETTSYPSLDGLFLNAEIITIMKKAYAYMDEELDATSKWTEKMKQEAFKDGKLPTNFPKFI